MRDPTASRGEPRSRGGVAVPTPAALRIDAAIEFCKVAPSVLADARAALGQPLPIACELLVMRVRALVRQGRDAEAAAAADALSDLRAHGKDDLYLHGKACAQCVASLAEGSKARLRCAQAAVHALERAVAQGYDSRGRLANESDFQPIRGLPEFQELLSRLRKPND